MFQRSRFIFGFVRLKLSLPKPFNFNIIQREILLFLVSLINCMTSKKVKMV
jgi:hypothetical protein